MTDQTTVPILHVLAQDGWHDPAAIVGDRLALEALRDAIDAALHDGHAAVSVFANDGEGYRLAIVHRNDMTDAPLGYTDEIAAHHSEVWPRWLQEAAYGR